MYLCLDCYEVYDNNIAQIKPITYKQDNEEKQWLMCPKSNCFGHVVEVDELILPTIITLNKKGYKTLFCCSNHFYSIIPDSYIIFEKGTILPNLPKDYYIDDISKIGLCIRNDFKQYLGNGLYNKNFDKYKMFKEININANNLLEWAESLPKCQNIKEGE